MTPDPQLPSTELKAGTIAAVVIVSLVVAYVRFSRPVSLPPKPPPPAAGAPASEQLEHLAESVESWRRFIAQDAAAAGLKTPSPTEMARKLRHRVDDEPRTIAPGEPAIEAAGLRITAGVADDDGGRKLLTLTIENLVDSDLAYHVVTDPRPSSASCAQRSILSYNATVVHRGGKEVRSECGYRNGMSLRIERIETVELVPLMALYVSRLPPAALGADARLTRGHHPDLPSGWTVCTTVASQSVRTEIEQGEIAWRDLVDFYARHRCETYSFPEGYRAFEKDDARRLPVVE
jgi:hypothetical protein